MCLAFAILSKCNASPVPAGPPIPIRHRKRTGPFPPDKKQYLHYGPEFGVTYSTVPDHPKNFDDTEYLGIPNDTVNYRELLTFKCWHTPGQEGNKLSGQSAVYAYSSDHIPTNYHGWKGFMSRLEKKEWTLQPIESWQSIQVLACDGKFVGINAAMGNGTGVACGRYWIKKGDTGCEEKILKANKGYRIIGLYGDGNGVINEKHQGTRNWLDHHSDWSLQR